MKQNYKIHNLSDLKAMQVSLNNQQEKLEKEIIDSKNVVVLASPIKNLIKPDPLKVIKVDGKVNVPGKAFAYLLPLIFNRIILRRSGFLTKMIVGIAASRAGKRLGPKVAMWMIRFAERYIRNRRTKCLPDLMATDRT